MPASLPFKSTPRNGKLRASKAPETHFGKDLIFDDNAIREYLSQQLTDNHRLQHFAKWSEYLPIDLRVSLLIDRA